LIAVASLGWWLLLLLAGCRLADVWGCFLVTAPRSTALLSGRYSYTVGAAGGVITNGRPNALPLNVSTVADNLRSGGWRCLAAGKWDAGMHSWAVTPTFRGFERFVGFCTSHDCPGLLPGLDCQL
jgi:arylsulfatase A-like enzyme